MLTETADEGKRGDGSGTSSLADMTLEPVTNGFYLKGPLLKLILIQGSSFTAPGQKHLA